MKDFFKKYKFIFIALLVVIGVSTTMQYIAYSTNNETLTSTIITDIAGNEIQEQIQIEEEFNLNYKIKPRDLELNMIPGATKKIVLVVDTSKDMTQVKLDIVKGQIKNFISYFEDYNEVEIGLVSFKDKGEILESFVQAPHINSDEFVNKLVIDNSVEQKSNIGDGLRLAYYMLYGENNENVTDDKYVILLNNKNANYYSSSTHNGKEYYTNWSKDESYYVIEENKSFTYGNEYSNVIVSEKLKKYNESFADNKIKLLTMALNTDTSSASSLNKSLINSIKVNQNDNSSLALSGQSQNEISNNFNTIQQRILDKNKPPAATLMAMLKVKETLPQKTELNEESIRVVQNNINSEGTSQYINGILDLSYSYEYQFNTETQKYEADEITVSYKAKGVSEGKAEFGKGTAYLVLASNNQSAINLKRKTINYVKQEDVFVTIQLQDSKGKIEDLYDSKIIEPIGRIYDKSDIKTEFNQVYQLFGQSKAMISFEEGDTNYLKYNIINLYDDNINNIWTGMKQELTSDTLVDFPKETGIYYIVYEAGEKTNEASEDPMYEVFGRGIYGPFVIDNRFDLTRDVEYKGKDTSVYKYELSYNIVPRDIKLTEIYRTEKELENIKANILKESEEVEETQLEEVVTEKEISETGELPEIQLENQEQAEEGFSIISEFDVINPVLKETIPAGLSIGSQIVGEGLQPYEVQRIEEVMSVDLSRAGEETIKYILYNGDSDVKNWVYKAEPIVVKFEATTDINQSAIVKFVPQSGTLSYKDLTLNNSIERVAREQFFESFTSEFQTTSKISGQGIFDNVNPNISLGDSINVTEGMNYSIGTRLDINSDNTTFIIKLPTSATIDKNSTFIYEVKNGTIVYESKANVFIYESGDEITLTNRNINKDTDDKGQVLADSELTCGAKYIVICNLEFEGIDLENNILDSILYFGSQEEVFPTLNIESNHQLKFIKQELPDLF